MFTPDHALDSILDPWDLPVNQEADGTFAQLEIGKQLGSMDGMDLIDSLVFDEYAFINQEIGPISAESTIWRATSSLSIHYLIARQLNEPKFFLCGLCGLRGSKCETNQRHLSIEAD